MTEDFEKPDPSETEPAEPEAELPSPFSESEVPPLPEDVEEAAAEEPVAPPPLPDVVIEEASPEVEEVAPPLPEALAETEVLGTPPFETPAPEPVESPSQQPITFGSSSSDAAAPPPVTPAPEPVEMSPAEQATPEKDNQTLIIVLIVVAVLLFLCCCCVLPVGLILANLDEILWELGISLLAFA
ncbi:MAG: hypothetical protein ACP5J4_07435 [Anaerolineae bacterium]